jgi:hypothetical protein
MHVHTHQLGPFSPHLNLEAPHDILVLRQRQVQHLLHVAELLPLLHGLRHQLRQGLSAEEDVVVEVGRELWGQGRM